MNEALIAGSDPASVKLAQIVLVKAGWRVTTALSADDAIRALAASEPDVVITSLIGIEGQRVVDAVRARTIPFVVVSPLDPQDLELEVALDATTFIRTPIDITLFAAQISRALGAHRP